MSKMSKRSKAELSMVIVACIWGATFVLVKNALNDIGPFLFLGLRFILAFFILVALAWSSFKKTRLATVGYGCLLGFFLFIGYVFQTVGLKYTSSSHAGFITGISVVLVPIIYAFMHRRLPELRVIITVVLAAAGLFLLSIQDDSFRLSFGDLLVLICAFGFAFHIVFVDRYSFRHNAVAITAIQILFVGVLSLAIGLIADPWPGILSARLIGALLITSVFATSLAFLLQNAMQKYSTPTRFAIVLATEPVFAALAGAIWAGERLSQRGLIGAALILVSMLISILTRKAKEPVVEQIG